MKQICFSGNFVGRGVRTALGWAALTFLFVSVSGKLGAQSALLPGFNEQGNLPGGFQLYDVSAFSGWESLLNPQGGFVLPSASGLKGDGYLGAGAAMGWSRHGDRNSLSVGYSVNYVHRFRYSDLSMVNQALTLGLGRGRRLSPKWTLGFSGSAGISNYDQMLFTPSVFSNVLAAPGTFDDLAAAVLAGKYTNDQLASLLTGAPLIDTPARIALFGDRIFFASLAPSLSYAHSQRLSITFSSYASLVQNFRDRNTQATNPQQVYLIPRAISAGAGVSVSYALTPRTQIGVSTTSGRGFSSFEQSYTTTGSAFVGRTMGMHWFMQAHAGGGFVTYIGSQHLGNIGTTPVFGGSLGYKLYSHSFMGTYEETLGQSYGAGAARTTNTNVAWNWARPGRSWGLNSSYMRERFSSTTFGNVSGWIASFGMTRAMGRHLMLQTAYTYASYARHSILSPYDASQNAVRGSVVWIPAGERR